MIIYIQVLDRVSERTDKYSAMPDKGKQTEPAPQQFRSERKTGKSKDLADLSTSSSTHKRSLSTLSGSSSDDIGRRETGNDGDNNMTVATDKKRNIVHAYSPEMSTPDPPSRRYHHIPVAKESFALKLRYSDMQKKELKRLFARLDFKASHSQKSSGKPSSCTDTSI